MEKCCTSKDDHGGCGSVIYKCTMEAREDVAIIAIIKKHVFNTITGQSVASNPSPVKKRVMTPTKDGRGKKRRDNSDGDGPTISFSLVELFAGLCSFALAALIGAWPVQLSTFYEISPSAVAYSEHFFGVPSAGDVRQVVDAHHGIVTLTMDCSPYSRAGLHRCSASDRTLSTLRLSGLRQRSAQ